ncbi:MAG: beta-galactosidase trimerization domain-containing protein [Armatimonadetes bacterium]|nr:beta-galactosidase trimerization domain-containing protein [Armatimonadota bacterium]
MSNWYADTLLKIHFDMHTPADVERVGAEFDPAAFAAAIKSTGCEAVCFFSRCTYGWSYYPSQVGPPHPHLQRDLFGDGLAALKAEGIRVIAYCAIDNLPPPLEAAHPDWFCLDSDGLPRHGNGETTLVCAFSPFAEELMIPQFEEIATRYPVDGFFLDGVYMYFYHASYSEYARSAFGRPIPVAADDPDWRAYRHCQVDRVWDVMNRAAEAIDRARPGCLLGVNWLAAPRWAVPPPPKIGYLTGDPPLHNCTFETAFHLAAWGWRDQPADLMNERMLHHWQDFTCRTPETLDTEFATAIAQGGKLFLGDLLKPVRVQPDPDVMRLARRSFSFAAERRETGMGLRPHADVAILISPEIMRLQGPSWSLDESAVRGAYLAIAEAGLTADVLYDGDLTEHLRRYRALLVPEQAYVSRSAAAAVGAFVAAGGGLLVTGAVPAAVDPSEPTAAAEPAVLASLLGVAADGVHPFDLTYLVLRGSGAEDLWRPEDDFRPAVPVPGTCARVRAAGCDVLARVTAPGQTYQIGAKPPGEDTGCPGITLNGRCAFAAFPLAGDLWRRGNPGAKYVLQALLRRVADVTVERIGPPCGQLTRLEAAGRTVLHLTAYQPDRRTAMPQVIERPPAIAGVHVRLRDPRTPVTAHVEPAGTAVPAERDGEWLRLPVPPFSIHTAVVVEWGE